MGKNQIPRWSYPGQCDQCGAPIVWLLEQGHSVALKLCDACKIKWEPSVEEANKLADAIDAAKKKEEA